MKILALGISAACTLALLPTLAPAQSLDVGFSASTKPDYSIIYTGRLFGYFRYPSEQASDEKGCPDPATVPVPAEVAQFRASVGDLGRSGMPILVAMGDNFAPELLARAIRNRETGTPHAGELVSKDLFTPDPAGNGWHQDAALSPASLRELSSAQGAVPSDNVGCFLRLIGFNAAVPGQQDFNFGPERLRQLARFLAEPAAGQYRPVQMLAANLLISTKPHNPAPVIPSSALPAAIQAALKPDAGVQVHLPSTVMPWLPDVTIESKIKNFEVFDCLASHQNPRQFDLPSAGRGNCLQLHAPVDAPNHFRFEKPQHPSGSFLSGYFFLDPGDNHALCVVQPNAAAPITHCELFSVQYPFFQYRPDSGTSTPAPYYLSSQSVAVFGVLDPSLASYIGELDGTWMNEDPKFDTTIEITDPVEAVRQQIAACDLDPRCRAAHKILLAQMPYYKASQMATKLDGIDLVIAQADPEHATGNESTRRTIGGPHSSRDSNRSAFVLAPGFAYHSTDDPLSINLRRADFYSEVADGDAIDQALTNTVRDPPVPAPSAFETLHPRMLATRAAAATGTPQTAGPAQSYENLALLTMEKFCGSDIALLQHRDIFTGFDRAIAFWPRDRSYTTQQLLDEVLWNQDFVFCLPVKGSTLKKVLQESAAFDQQDKDDLSLEVEKGRGLSTLGLTQDPVSKDILIRGEPMDDQKIYGVAMTDYLAFGNTGYPEFASEAVPPRVHLTSLRGLNRLTGLACLRLPPDPTTNGCQAEEIQSAQYFDAIRITPFDTSPGLTALTQLRQWVSHPLRTQPLPTLFEKPSNAPQNVVENRGLWWLTLQNMSLEYDLTFIRGADQTVPANFSGINSFSQLSTPESSQLGLWTRVRGGYAFPRLVDFFASGEERYTRAAVREAAVSGNGDFGPYQLTLNNNIVRAEFGVISKPLFHTLPIHALVSENLSTQVSNPFQQLAVPVSCSGSGCVPGATSLTTFKLGKNFLVMTRLGARLQNKVSWFEAGREYGENLGIPFGYTLQDPGRAQPFSCSASGNMSLGGCVASDPFFTSGSKVLPNLENQRIAGWFMDFHTAAPLYRSKLQLTVDSYGEVFDRRANDSGFNTRYYEDLTVALKVPLFGNLTFAPQVETFLFQNKVVPNQQVLTNHYSFITSSLKLEYGFDWRRGVGWWRALRYPNGVSIAPSSGPPAP
ncbi:MAG TPA: 5'-nucleotidase C-terminal domain-containing protein [Bryobacteraceae bacterium]|jgi:hypothetical protein|nr:5'-nucleotidase C-terminal domain-containing protein [Bryobacteraceae bacterium]